MYVQVKVDSSSPDGARDISHVALGVIVRRRRTKTLVTYAVDEPDISSSRSSLSHQTSNGTPVVAQPATTQPAVAKAG
jgi:hypothetical protein